jgi:hypothetical protein
VPAKKSSKLNPSSPLESGGRLARGRTMLAVNPIDIEALSGMRGLSERKLLAMKIFTCEFLNARITKQPVSQLPLSNPSPSRIGKPSSPRPYLRNSKAASLPLRKSKPNSRATSPLVANLDCQMNPKIQNRNPVTARSLNMLMRGTNPFFHANEQGWFREASGTFLKAIWPSFFRWAFRYNPAYNPV